MRAVHFANPKSITIADPNLTYDEGMAQWLPFLSEHRTPAFNLYGSWDGTFLNATTNAIEQTPFPYRGLDWYQMLADNGAKDLNLMLVPQCAGCNESALNATVDSTLRQLEPAVAALTNAGLIDKAMVYGFGNIVIPSRLVALPASLTLKASPLQTRCLRGTTPRCAESTERSKSVSRI